MMKTNTDHTGHVHRVLVSHRKSYVQRVPVKGTLEGGQRSMANKF